MALVEQHVGPPSIGVEPRWESAHQDVSRRLAIRYDRVDLALIEAVVARHFDAYVDARITLYVPLLVERSASDEIRRCASVRELRRP
ncbi:MAG TPA: hypothetical protein VFV00_03135 [Acidimicrobiales bacterium]|nr:hypothetical protein [Acidimicrobiales bacterium]